MQDFFGLVKKQLLVVNISIIQCFQPGNRGRERGGGREEMGRRTMQSHSWHTHNNATPTQRKFNDTRTQAAE